VIVKKSSLEENYEMGENKIYFKAKDIVIYNEDFLTTRSVEESSVDLIVTSPPYNVDIHYNSFDDTIPYRKYLEFTELWLEKALKLVKDDGRMCLNIPLDKNKGGQQSVYADIITIAKKVGWKYHSTIVWNEGNISRRTAWGSWLSPSAPYVIAPVEMIAVLYKKRWKKQGRGESDITKEEFIEWTNGIWTFPGESKKRVNHPAPFPLELPKRCIKLFTFVGETVLDPFLGSGTTLVACALLNRRGIGIDIDKGYCEIAKNRLIQEGKLLESVLFDNTVFRDKPTKYKR
jgi:site-specific DNA-methyltransferase (adenine-specific)